LSCVTGGLAHILSALTPELRVAAPSLSECREEVRAVFASRTFQQSPRLSRLLQYITSKALLGEAEKVTEYTIALDVFGKPEGFRESKDAIVRVEVHRLRRKLEAFYNSEGADHRVRIVIPPGTYTADFRVHFATEEEADSPEPAEHPPETSEAIARAQPEHAPAASRKWLGPAVVAVLAVIAIGIVSLTGRHRDAVRNNAAESMPVAALNTEVHILAGYTGNPWKDTAGHTWLSDRYFKGGESRSGPSRPMIAPPDRRLFNTMREGTAAADSAEDLTSFSYDIPMRQGTYELRLYFSDPLMDTPLLQAGEDRENARRFMINLNGQTLIQQLDVVADESSMDVDVRVFNDIVPAADGKVHLEFAPQPDRPFVNALELMPARAGHANPIRLAARLDTFTDADGKSWGPDNYYTRGRLIRQAVPPRASGFPELLRSERYGNFSYAIPVPEGSYTLSLHFAETMFSPFAPSTICRGPGCRVFDVSCNGRELLHQFDIFQQAGGAFLPVVRTFHGLRPNGQGKLLISFSPSVNYAEVRAIEVVDERP